MDSTRKDPKKPANFNIGIIPTNMSSRQEKKYKMKKMNQIASTINALLNSNGGKVELPYERNPPKEHIDIVIRAIEQKIVELIGITSIHQYVTEVKSKVAMQKIVIIVLPNDELWTLNYNLCLPVTSQVVCVPPTAPLEKIRNIIKDVDVSGNESALLSYHRDFVLDQKVVGLEEDVNVQFKRLESKPAKCTTLGDRIIKNRFTDYISAFANHQGGHIYFGVDDNGDIKGEVVKDIEVITGQVQKALTKMIWPNPLERAKHWDIFFVPVKDPLNGTHTPNTYVIVVGVVRCPGGVFKEQPESYFVNSKGDTEQMDFATWKEKLLSKKLSDNSVEVTSNTQEIVARKMTTKPSQLHASSTCRMVSLADIPHDVPKLSWSSQRNLRIYHWFTVNLVECRNNKEMGKFEQIAASVASYPNSDAELVVISERVAVDYKKHNFQHAEFLLEKLADLRSKGSVNDGEIFRVREIYLRSRLEKSKGNYDNSYKLAQDGLQELQCVPTSFLTTWFYIHAATVTTMPRDPKKFHEAQRYLEMAEASARLLECLPENRSDLNQKLCIYQAMILLGFSQPGDALESKDVSMEAVNEAEAKLHMIRSKGEKLTHFREIQYNIAQSDLFYRKAGLSTNETDQQAFYQRALKFSKKAYNLACDHQFTELILYANTRMGVLSDRITIVAHALPGKADSKMFNDQKDFIGN